MQTAPDGTFIRSPCPWRCPSSGCVGPWSAARAGRLAGLVLEQVDGVAGVVPQQVVGPAAGLAEGVRVGAAEEVRLTTRCWRLQLARHDAAVHPLVARVEAPGVAHHGDERRCVLRVDHGSQSARLGHRDLHQDVLAGVEALDGLGGVQRGRRGQDRPPPRRAAPGTRPRSSDQCGMPCCRRPPRCRRRRRRRASPPRPVDPGDRRQMLLGDRPLLRPSRSLTAPYLRELPTVTLIVDNSEVHRPPPRPTGRHGPPPRR